MSRENNISINNNTEYGGGNSSSIVSAIIMHEELAHGDSGIATAATVTTWAFLPAIIADFILSRASIAKVHAADAAVMVTNKAMKLMGSYGYAREYDEVLRCIPNI